jgi:hypothetical protein
MNTPPVSSSLVSRRVLLKMTGFRAPAGVSLLGGGFLILCSSWALLHLEKVMIFQVVHCL